MLRGQVPEIAKAVAVAIENQIDRSLITSIRGR